MHDRRRFWIVIGLTVIAMALPFTAGSQGAKPGQWALLIGVGDYPEGVPDLAFAPSDALAIRDSLVKRAGFPEDHVKVISDVSGESEKPTKANILAAVDSFLGANVKTGDEIIVFLSGHGVSQGLGDQAKSYFLPSDVDASSAEAVARSGIDLQELARKLGALPARQYVIFLDACRNDPFRGKGLKPNLMTDVMARDLRLVARGEAKRPEPPTAVIFYSCQVGEQSFEDPDLQGGLFTHFVVKGIEALADKPDGRVEAGRLAAFLSENVRKRAEEKGKYQSPTMVAIDVRSPVVVVNASPFAESVPAPGMEGSALILPTPEDARVFVDGQPVGAGRIEKALAPGEHTVRAEREGFHPAEAKVFVQGGYRVETTLTLKPSLAKPEAQESLERGMEAEKAGLTEQAIAHYKMALQADPDSKVAATKLAGAYVAAKRWRDAAILMHGAVKQFAGDPAIAAAFARTFADWGSSDEKQDQSADDPPSGMAKKKDARREALKVAEAAAKASPTSAEAQMALGYVLLQDPKDRRKALDAFVAASVAEPGNPEAYFYVGLTHRLAKQYAQAIPQLKKALELRPDYYDAHLELAYCHHALGQTEDAKREYEIAASMRTESNDQAQMASTHVALSAIYAQQAQEESKKGNEEQAERYRASSEGYTEEARTFDPDLKAALRVLAFVGLENRIREFLPGPLRTLWDALRPGGIGDIIRGGIRPPIPPR